MEPKDIELVVRAVTLAKGHIESINAAYRMMSEWTALMHQLATAGEFAGAKKAEELRDQANVNAAENLQRESKEMTEAMGRAIAALEKYVNARRKA